MARIGPESSMCRFCRSSFHRRINQPSRSALAGGTLSGLLTLHVAPSANLHAATKAYVDAVSAALALLTARVEALEQNTPPTGTTRHGGATTWDGEATT